MGFPGRCVWEGSIFRRHQLLVLQNRGVWITAVLPARHRPGLLHSLLEGKGLFSGPFLNWHIWWFLRTRVGGGRYWESLYQQLESFALSSAVTALLLSPGVRVGASLTQRRRTSPWGAMLLKPTWNSTSVCLEHRLQHHCRRASIALSMATSLFSTLQKFMKCHSRKEAVDFYLTWGNVW